MTAEQQNISGRLRHETLMRVVDFGDSVLSIVDRLERDKRPRRVVDQLTGSGTSVGAQLFEASEAVSRADFLRILGIAAKEANETRYWLMLIAHRRWAPDDETVPCLDEATEFLRMIKAMIGRSRASRP